MKCTKKDWEPGIYTVTEIDFSELDAEDGETALKAIIILHPDFTGTECNDMGKPIYRGTIPGEGVDMLDSWYNTAGKYEVQKCEG